MTLLLQRSDIGENLREPTRLVGRRRRLSTIVKQHREYKRPFVVSVHRENTAYAATDETVVLRKNWKDTLVGPRDVVVITYLPLGGMGGGGQGGGKQIGGAIAMLVLAIAVPWAIGAIAPAIGLGGVLGTTAGLTLAGKVVAMGIIAGLGYLISKATQPKSNKHDDNRPVYGVSGGGNVARAGDRIPVNYGRCWYAPDLSQADYFTYRSLEDGDSDQILRKRVTLGGGPYHVHTIKVGDAVMWDEVHGLHNPFKSAKIEFIAPGAQSTLVPGAVWSSENVNGVDLGYADDPVLWHGPFPASAPGVQTNRIQLDFSFPQGYYANSGTKGKLATPYGVVFEYRPIDDDGNATGSYTKLYEYSGIGMAPRAVRKTKNVLVPMGRYEVRARNYTVKTTDYQQSRGMELVNAVYWDGLRAHLFNEPLRPEVQEIAFELSAQSLGSTMTFSDLTVETTKILPVYRNGVWVEEPTRKAVWAFADIVRNATYGGAVGNDKFDIATASFYANSLTGNDTFDGQIRGPVSVFEAASTALGVIRAEPVLIGDVWSMVRDEPKQFTKHVVTRREIVKDTSGVEFDLDMSDGEADVLVDYLVDGDPKRRAEWRETIGQQTITPRRISLFGVSSHEHAVALARWYAAVAFYRRETRLLSTEMQGKIFNRNDGALIDCWFMDATQTTGIESRSGNVLTVDTDLKPLPAGAHIMLRDPKGLSWGPVAITAINGRDLTLSSSDITTVEGFTGKTLTSLLSNTSRRRNLSVQIGTVSEVSESYLIRAAKPEANNRWAISVVNDAPEVWSVLGETVPAGPPVPGVIDNSVVVPVLPWINGKIVQKAATLGLEWTLGRAQNTDRYQVQLKYGDRDDWELISDGPATDGFYPVDFSRTNDPKVDFRARAINRLGAPSDWVFGTATLFAPKINSDNTDLEVQIENLAAQLRYELSLITAQGQASLQEMRANLDKYAERLANASATHVGETYEKVELIKATMTADKSQYFAAILSIQKAYATADDILAQRIDMLEAGGSTDSGARAMVYEESLARIQGDNVLAMVDTQLQAKIDKVGTDLTAEADLRQTLTTQVNVIDGKVTSLSQDLEVLSTSQGGNDAQLTLLAQSVDGIKVEYGVVGTINGATGGFLFRGIKRLDGSVSYTVEIEGDFFVDGSITGRKISGTSLIISGQAQVGSLVIGNQQLQDFAATQATSATGNGSASAAITVRTNARVALVIYSEAQSDPVSQAVRIFRDGGQIALFSQPKVQVGDVVGSGGTPYLLPATFVYVDRPAAGNHTYTVTVQQKVTFLLMEFAK